MTCYGAVSCVLQYGASRWVAPKAKSMVEEMQNACVGHKRRGTERDERAGRKDEDWMKPGALLGW